MNSTYLCRDCNRNNMDDINNLFYLIIDGLNIIVCFMCVVVEYLNLHSKGSIRSDLKEYKKKIKMKYYKLKNKNKYKKENNEELNKLMNDDNYDSEDDY